MSKDILVTLSVIGVTLLLDVFADLIVITQLFCASGSVQNIGGFDLAATAISSEDSSEPHSFL